jgi:hypothetical protein
MRGFRVSLVAVVGSAALLCGASARGQGYAAPTGGAAPSFRQPGSYQRVSGRSNPALTYYGGSPALAYLPAGRSQQLPAPLPVQTGAAVKPFTSVPQHPSVTPYLALEQRESDVGLPNYYLYVQPQLEQQTLNNVQQAQYRRLQQQMRRGTTGAIVPAGLSGGMPTTGHSTQFMNNGGYYPGLRP